jgi:hypothetical protein
MKERGDVGVATFVMRGKERPVAIFSDNGISSGDDALCR